jgi:predicted  nucleic acid-binding Zn-ribbon protein
MTKTISAEVLQELHRYHRQLADLNGRLVRGPKLVRIAHQLVTRTESELESVKEEYKRTRMDSDDRQLQLRDREAKIANLQRKLNECKSNAEFRALKDQIAAEKAANSVLEDEIFEKLERVDELKAMVEKTEQSLAKAREESAKTEQRVKGEQARMEADLERVKSGLVEAETNLPPDFQEEYRRMIRGRGEDALAPVDGDSCSGCSTVLSVQTMNELYMKKMTFCNSCGCLLYLPEDRAVGAETT